MIKKKAIAYALYMALFLDCAALNGKAGLDGRIVI